jgi:type I restriction enzyme S subunit
MTKQTSRLDNLIKKYCPNGVVFKELGEVSTVETGSQLNKTVMFDIGKYPVLNGGVNPSGRYDKYNTEADTIAISQGGSAGYVNFVSEKFWAGALVRPVSDKIINKFIYYVLKQNQNKLQEAKLGACIPGLSKKVLLTFKIPIPPIEVQEEIVRILDTFTQLESELELRTKQYEYYCNSLLSFEGGKT